MPYTPPEKPSQIDLTEKIDRAEFIRRCEASIAECTREMSLASVAMAKPGMEMSMMLVSLVWQVKIPRIGMLMDFAKSSPFESRLVAFEDDRVEIMETIHANAVRDLFPSAPRESRDAFTTSKPGSWVVQKKIYDEMVDRFGKAVSSMYVDTATAAELDVVSHSVKPHPRGGKTALMLNEAFEAALRGKSVVVCTARGNIEIEKAVVHGMRGRKLDLVIIDDIHHNEDARIFVANARHAMTSGDLLRSDAANRAMSERPIERMAYGMDVGREGGDSSCITTFKVFSDGTRNFVSVIEYKGAEPKRVAFIDGMAYSGIVQGCVAKNKPAPGEVAIRDEDFKALFADPSVSPYVRDIGECDAEIRARATSERAITMHFHGVGGGGGFRQIEAKFASTCTECLKNIYAGDAVMWKPGHPAIHFACARIAVVPRAAYFQGEPRSQFRALVEIAYGKKLEACAKAVGVARLESDREFNKLTGLMHAVARVECDSDLRKRVIQRLDEGHPIASFTYTEKL